MAKIPGNRFLSCVFGFLLLSVFIHGSAAAEAQPAEVQTVEPAEQQPAELPADTAGLLSNEQLQRELQQHQQRIQALESELGPYDPALIEALADAGSWYQSQGLHESAAEIFARVLHTIRINQGLYAESQVSVLDSLITSLRANREWQLADDRHFLRFQLQQRLFEPGTPEYLQAITELGEWRLHANADNLLGRSVGQQLRESESLQQLYQGAIDSLPGEGQDSSGELVKLSYGLAVSAYQQTSLLLQLPPGYFEGRGSRYLVRTVCYPGGGQAFAPEEGDSPQYIQADAEMIAQDDQGNVTRICTTERVENPDYFASQRYEQRSQLERSAATMQAGIRQLRTILESSSSLPDAERQYYQERLTELETLHTDLNRAIRRSISRWNMGRFRY